MMIDFGERTRSYAEVCHLFNDLYPDRDFMFRSNVDRKKCEKFALELEKSPQTSTTLIALNHEETRHLTRI